MQKPMGKACGFFYSRKTIGCHSLFLQIDLLLLPNVGTLRKK